MIAPPKMQFNPMRLKVALLDDYYYYLPFFLKIFYFIASDAMPNKKINNVATYYTISTTLKKQKLLHLILLYIYIYIL